MGKLIPRAKNLATVNPRLASEWHPTKNGDLTPSMVTASSNKKVHWLGRCGHEWEAKIVSRRQGSGCPICANRAVLAGYNDLATTNPDLASEWHPTKNGDLTPDMVTSGSHKKVHWLGQCGHEWEAVIFSRQYGSGCPICANQAVLLGHNDLATTNPDLASEWHPTKNGKLTPDMVAACSNKRIHWLGRCGHEWKAKIEDRHYGTGCPICANKVVLLGYNDLATANPALASEWHPTKNGDLTPGMVTAYSEKRVHWQGCCGHEWIASIYRRHNGSGCPICANKVVLRDFNDLATANPALASEWHPTKNDDLTPDMVTAYSHKKVHWLGHCGHEWEAKIGSRQRGSGCPICANKAVLRYVNDLATVNPALASEWHPTKNGDLTPGMVTAYSEKRVHWQGRCGHEWIASIYSRHNGSGCPICANKVVLPGYNDLATVNPALASEWHPSKNGDLTPDMVTACSHKKVYWLGNCGHEWEAKIEVRQYGNGCPICANRAVLPGYNDLATVNPALASQWHPVKNGNLTPDMVTVNSHKRVHWKGLCGHEWIAGIKNRQHGSGCPFCANRVVLPGYNDLATVNPALASQWHPVKNGNLTPDMVTVNSHKKVHWLGRCGHEWEAIIQSRQRGSGCPICANKVVLRNVNDLASVNPALASEWHPTKNGNLTPDMVTANSHKKVYWLGNCGHEWEAKIEDRQYGNGCPICNGRIQYKKKYNYLGGVL